MEVIPFAIIGSGPAGLCAAIAYGSGAVIFERNKQAGVKLLLSGSGQCNFSNALPKDLFLEKCGRAAKFLKPSLYNFDQNSMVSILLKAGCKLYSREDGKLFPASQRAVDVRNALLNTALRSGAIIRYKHRIDSIETYTDQFRIHSNQGDYIAQNVLLAGGGKSYPQTGSDGSLCRVAENLGLKVSPLKPSLTSIELRDKRICRTCAGISFTPHSIHISNHPGLSLDAGDILFTHKGLSGPGIINNSYLFEAGSKLRVCLVREAAKIVQESLTARPRMQLHNALCTLDIADELIKALLTEVNIDPAQRACELSRDCRKKLIDLLSNLEFEIYRVDSWDKAMATSGGVMLSELSSKTLESRAVPGLYCAGEMLDYDLPTGGFNIQVACSTGYIAGQSAKKKTSTNLKPHR